MIVIGCGKDKLDVPAKARELYVGSLFRQARRYAEATGEPWAILSAKHGIVCPDDVIEPYDVTLDGLDFSELAKWAGRAAGLFCRRMRPVQGDVVRVLAGVRYAHPFLTELAERGVQGYQPLVGLGVGRRLGWLRREREQLGKGVRA